jgi:hypothetical protein
MKIYHYHPYTRKYLYQDNADESPLEPGVFLLPAYATFVEPPCDIPEDSYISWSGNGWEILKIPDIPKPLQTISEEPNLLVDPWEELRIQRNQLLSNTDYLFLRDYQDLSTEKETAWRAYRQALRDLPKNTIDPTTPEWPTKPTFVD